MRVVSAGIVRMPLEVINGTFDLAVVKKAAESVRMPRLNIERVKVHFLHCLPGFV